MQSDIDEREDYDFVRFLRNDAAVAARIGDFCGDELTSFLALRGLAPATSLDVARDDEASESGAATIAPSTRRDRPPAVSQPKSLCPGGLFAGTGDQRRRLAG
jgi:hypothetical protein